MADLYLIGSGLGWSDFFENNLDTYHVVLEPKSRLPETTLPVTQKSEDKFCYFTFLKVAPEILFQSSLVYLKA